MAMSSADDNKHHKQMKKEATLQKMSGKLDIREKVISS